MNLFYCSSSNSNRSFKHFTAEGAEELRDREIESSGDWEVQSLNH